MTYDCILTLSVRLPRGAPFPPKLQHHSQGGEGKQRLVVGWSGPSGANKPRSCFFYKKVFLEQRSWGFLTPTGDTRNHLALINALHIGPGCMATLGELAS